MRIFVNGTQHVLDGETASYEAIVQIAGYKPERVLSVTYCGPRYGDSERSGSLRPGKSITAEENMRFDVGDTSNA